MAADGGLKTEIASAWDAGARLLPGGPWLTVVYYHAVRPELANAFDAQMAYLRTTANIVAPGYNGPLDPSRPNVAVTFDDAFRSVREHALPSLIKHQVPVTIFAPTGWAGREPGWNQLGTWDSGEVVMSLAELAELPSDLVTLGSHSVDHVLLPGLRDDALEAQLVRSREVLEATTGGRVDLLSLPYGDYDARVIQVAARVGYRCVFTDQPGLVRQGHRGALRGRTAVAAADDPRTFALKIRGAFAWLPAAARAKAVLRGEVRALLPGWRWQARFR